MTDANHAKKRYAPPKIGGKARRCEEPGCKEWAVLGYGSKPFYLCLPHFEVQLGALKTAIGNVLVMPDGTIYLLPPMKATGACKPI